MTQSAWDCTRKGKNYFLHEQIITKQNQEQKNILNKNASQKFPILHPNYNIE